MATLLRLFVFDDLDGFEEYRQVFLDGRSFRICLMFFSRLGWGYGLSGGPLQEENVILIISRVPTTYPTWCVTVGVVTVDHLVEVVLVRFIHFKVYFTLNLTSNLTLFPFSPTALFRKKSLCHPHVRPRELFSIFLRMKYLCQLFGICMEIGQFPICISMDS